MRIGLQTWGSEGDIRPFLALGLGLQLAGHEVEIVVTDLGSKDYRALGSRLGLCITPVATPIIADPAECDRIGKKLLLATNFIAQERILIRRLFDPFIPAMLVESRRLVRECDLVIGHYYHHPLRMAAELSGVPEVSVNLNHGLVPSRYFSLPGFPMFAPPFNLLFRRLSRFILDKLFLPSVNRLRAKHGLCPLHDLTGEAWSSPLLNLVAVSTVLCKPPPDWHPRHQVCGFLSMPYETLPPVPTELEAFLSAGPPPVYFGFGSAMADSSPSLRDQALFLLSTVRDLGCRAIIQIDAVKAGGLPQPSNVIWVGSPLPHASVFPRCAAVVHHGGAGTTRSVLGSGVPSVVVPHWSDQFLWAEELHRRGLAPKPVNFWTATPKRLARRVREVLGSPAMRERAREVRKRVEREDGVGRAVELIEGLANKTGKR